MQSSRAPLPTPTGVSPFLALAHERVVLIKISGEGIATQTPMVVTRAGIDVQPFNQAALDQSPMMMRNSRMVPTLYGSEMTVVVEPEVAIEGIVKNATTGAPLADCRLSTTTGFWVSLTANSDTAGKFRLSGLTSDRLGYFLSCNVADESSNYLSRSVRIDNAPVAGTVRVEVEMQKGIVVTGRVVDSRTGAGVAAGIRFAPLADNAYFGSKPGYDNYKSDHTMSGTDSEGRFRASPFPASRSSWPKPTPG